MSSLVLIQYGRTETVRSTRSPQFTSILELDYNFEEEQRLWFRLHDADLEEDRKKSSELGLMTCLLSEVGVAFMSCASWCVANEVVGCS